MVHTAPNSTHFSSIFQVSLQTNRCTMSKSTTSRTKTATSTIQTSLVVKNLNSTSSAMHLAATCHTVRLQTAALTVNIISGMPPFHSHSSNLKPHRRKSTSEVTYQTPLFNLEVTSVWFWHAPLLLLRHSKASALRIPWSRSYILLMLNQMKDRIHREREQMPKLMSKPEQKSWMRQFRIDQSSPTATHDSGSWQIAVSLGYAAAEQSLSATISFTEKQRRNSTPRLTYLRS